MCSCCDHDFSLTVIANNAIATPTASPVTLTVDRPLTDMPAGGCFDLRVPKALLKNANASPVQLSDGDVNGIAFVFRLDGADKSLGVNSRVCS